MNEIKEHFSSIAPHYDRVNGLLSLGLHKKWNQALIDSIQGEYLLDLCAGTGEIAFGYLHKNPSAHATLLDFCQEMLSIAQKKGESFQERFQTICGDAQQIPLPDSSVDAVSIAYGIRNIPDPERCFQEVYRVLRPGGAFAILELTRPRNPFVRYSHNIYLKTLVPWVGKKVTKNKGAYCHLSNSIQSFLSREKIRALYRKTGFDTPLEQLKLSGICTLWSASKT